MTIHRIRNALALTAILAAGISTPVLAEPQTRLVDCEAGSCLLVTGRRGDAGSVVRINGHAVAAQGGRQWRVSLPVETLRDWSAPYARTITVSVADMPSQATLPIGLLGHVNNLDHLVVRMK
ncbi:hypothetical protein [Novosphingobium sp. KN65.2]|uniref:hypothetical protein n=1 Tax=Novosphingobium sp. KN65.2 TaxID=1478134 RepID=UPI0005DEF814|nr:hypothetical protein [Novosphingobium sp. KN65.2]CDO35148.1 conserved exported hypothetical protein [Novosphingobium sp. KN65.2]